MKKIKLFSFPSFIKGKKSNGAEDYSGYKNWRAIGTSSTPGLSE